MTSTKRQQDYERQRERRQVARALGLCSCGTRVREGLKICNRCYERNLARDATEKEERASLARAAFVSDVDVVFSEEEVNKFVVRIGNIAVVVVAGKVSDFVTRRRFNRGVTSTFEQQIRFANHGN